MVYCLDYIDLVFCHFQLLYFAFAFAFLFLSSATPCLRGKDFDLKAVGRLKETPKKTNQSRPKAADPTKVTRFQG